jgi:membrane protease subunit HflK
VLKEALMLTDDENIINIQFAVQYILKDPVDYIFNNRTPDEAVMQVAKPRFARSSARTRWTSCSTKGASRSPFTASR